MLTMKERVVQAILARMYPEEDYDTHRIEALMLGWRTFNALLHDEWLDSWIRMGQAYEKNKKQ